MCPCIVNRIGIRQCWFLRRGQNQSSQRITYQRKERTNNKLNPHMMPGLGIETGPYWWDASALTAVPPLLPAPLTNLVCQSVCLRSLLHVGGFNF